MKLAFAYATRKPIRWGVVYHSNYMVWMEVGRVELYRSLGLRYRDMERDGLLLAVAEINCRYISPAHYDDEVTIKALDRKGDHTYGVLRLRDAHRRGWTAACDRHDTAYFLRSRAEEDQTQRQISGGVRTRVASLLCVDARKKTLRATAATVGGKSKNTQQAGEQVIHS